MTPTIMRQLWSVVETAQAKLLLQLDDASLVQWLVKQTETQVLLILTKLTFCATTFNLG